MSEQIEMLSDAVERLFGDADGSAARAEQEGWQGALWEQLEDLGIPLVLVTESADGVGGDWDDAYAVLHAAGRHAIPLPVGEAMLAARITLTNTSRSHRSRLFLRGALLSIIIFIFSYFMQVLGTSLRIPMSVAAWTPAIVVSLLGAIILARTDES